MSAILQRTRSALWRAVCVSSGQSLISLSFDEMQVVLFLSGKCSQSETKSKAVNNPSSGKQYREPARSADEERASLQAQEETLYLYTLHSWNEFLSVEGNLISFDPLSFFGHFFHFVDTAFITKFVAATYC